MHDQERARLVDAALESGTQPPQDFDLPLYGLSDPVTVHRSVRRQRCVRIILWLAHESRRA